MLTGTRTIEQRRITVAEIRDKVAAYEHTVQLVKAARARREHATATVRVGVRPRS